MIPRSTGWLLADVVTKGMDLEPAVVGVCRPLPAAAVAPVAIDHWMLSRGQEAAPAQVAHPCLDLSNAPVAVLYEEMARLGPQDGDRDALRPIDFHARRDHFRATFSYAVPTPRAVSRIAAFAGDGGVCEVGAGRALWARLLRDHGVRVDATDYAAEAGGISNAKSGYFNQSPHLFHPVRQAFARRAAAETEARTLMMIWPPYGNPVASLSLEAFRGDQLVYIGEDRHGCTADDAFFDQLESGWERVGGVGIPRWGRLQDRVNLYRRSRA